MFSTKQAGLYQRLQDYDLDDPTHEFGFTRHLMKNHGWTRPYAERAIAEYKKFVFLAMVADHQVVPSDSVDQVWHAHVLLTQSYWEEFCPQILGRKLHHHPARGGQEERAEFHQLYARTIDSYRFFFGEPPLALWSPAHHRFGSELKMQRISLLDHWIIPKRWPKWNLSRLRWFIVPMSFILSIFLAQSAIAVPVFGESPEHRIKSFLILGLSFGFGIIIRFLICLPFNRTHKPQLNSYQIAYLANKEQRALELALSRLVEQGYLLPHSWHRTFSIQKSLPQNAHPLEEQVMTQVAKTPQFKDLMQVNHYSMGFIKSSLVQEKLMISRLFSFILFAIKILFYSIVLLYFVCRPLIMMYFGGSTFFWCVAVLVLFPCVLTNHRTQWGAYILRGIKQRFDSFDTPQSVALYGYKALSGGKLDTLKSIALAAKAEEQSNACGCGC